MAATILLGIFLFLLILALGLLYSPPSAWIGRNKDKVKGDPEV